MDERVLIYESTLTEIADAIREKNESQEEIQVTEMAEQILAIQTGVDTTDGTAAAEDILVDKVAYVNEQRIIGTMVNNGAVAPSALDAGGSYTIPEGYHDGTGKIIAKDLASQTVSNAAADEILNAKTAWVNGVKVYGTMPNNAYVTQNLNCSDSYTIPKGYHNGTGKIYANSLASQTPATATASQILSGQTAYVDGAKVTGTMSDRTNRTTAFCGYEKVTVQTHPVDSNQALVTAPNSYGTAGYYDSTSYVTTNIANLKPDNIKAGVKVGRYNGDETNCIVGTFTSDATATAADILAGKTAYVNGVLITGTASGNTGTYAYRTIRSEPTVTETAATVSFPHKYSSNGDYWYGYGDGYCTTIDLDPTSSYRYVGLRPKNMVWISGDDIYANPSILIGKWCQLNNRYTNPNNAAETDTLYYITSLSSSNTSTMVYNYSKKCTITSKNGYIVTESSSLPGAYYLSGGTYRADLVGDICIRYRNI